MVLCRISEGSTRELAVLRGKHISPGPGSEKSPFLDQFDLNFSFTPCVNHPRDLGPGALGLVGFCGGRGSVGFVMSKVLYGTNKPAPVQGSRDTGI